MTGQKSSTNEVGAVCSFDLWSKGCEYKKREGSIVPYHADVET